MTNQIDKARFNSDPDFPYCYLITNSGFIFKTMRKADDKAIFSDLRTAQLHLLPRFAENAQKHQMRFVMTEDKQLMEYSMNKEAVTFVSQFSMLPEDVKSDETYIVQNVSSPDAIVPIVYGLVHELKIPMGSFRTVKIKKRNLIVFRKSEGYVVGFEDDPDGVYLLYREAEWVVFFKGVEEAGDKLTKHSYQFLAVVEKALTPVEAV